MHKVFFEIHSNLPREGPGDNKSTRRAFRMLTELPSKPRILDVGCGPGMQTIEIAKLSNGQITAVDNYQPYLEELKSSAANEGVSEKINTVNANMDNLGFEDKSFNAIWSEGAIFNIGFKKGLELWRKFLADKGYLAVSELCWLGSNAPDEVKNFFATGYPAMKTVEANLLIIKEANYLVVGYFVLPDASWWSNYYLPIKTKLPALKAKYQDDKEALAVIGCEELEIEMLNKYSKYYGYVFYVMQAQ